MRQNRRTMLGITVVVLVLMAALLVSGQRLNAKIEEGEMRITELTEQTAEEEARTEEITELQEYMKSDEYAEQVAKDKLGLVKDGEIVFRETDGE
jgi:cell division protein DivIC